MMHHFENVILSLAVIGVLLLITIASKAII
jgi:hypothetical protein